MSTTLESPRSRGALPPGPRTGWILGHTFAYMRDPLGFLADAVRTHGDLVRLRLGNVTTYVLVNPAHIEYVLRTHHENFIKDRLTQTISPLVGQGLLTSEGDYWKRQRRLARPAFQHHQIQRYADQMVDRTRRMFSHWGDGEERELHSQLSKLTLAIVAATLFDADVGADAEVVGSSLEVVMDYYFNPMRWFRIREHLPLPSTRRYRGAIGRIDEIMYRLIRERRAGGGETGDLISRLIAAREDDGTGGMSDRQIRDEAVTIFLAGHETTALALFYTLHLLALHPEVESRLAEEISRVLSGRLPTAADVPELPYTEWVVREAMRLYPPAWGIAREALEDCEIGGYRVPRGTQLFLVQYLVHRDPRWFEDPEAFRPERWAGDLIKRLPRCAYFPFGDGPRICIGNHFAMMEAVLVLATIVQRHRIAVLPDQTIELFPTITLRPRRGLRVRLEPRP
jgi:cytochrome P450